MEKLDATFEKVLVDLDLQRTRLAAHDLFDLLREIPLQNRCIAADQETRRQFAQLQRSGIALPLQNAFLNQQTH
jgi:hypothetical protein